jgi:tRNA pseudouridine55 synthase
VSGFLLLDKPAGITSNGALQRVKHLYQAQKAGHTGSLDPLATGMLPICFGEATKLSVYMLSADKTYRVTARLGVKTDTDDADGRVIADKPWSHLTERELRSALDSLKGAVEQVPPMYSAVKHEGQRLYRLARKGIEVERKRRLVTIHEIELERADLPIVGIRVRCSKGTYVRTLVTDLADSLGTFAHVTALRRLAVDPFDESSAMITLDALRSRADAGGIESLDDLLLPPDTVLADWPRVTLSEAVADKVRQGVIVALEEPLKPGLHRIYSNRSVFVGIGEVLPGPRLAPRRILG